MYETFYGFRSKPFSLLPDPEFLYPSKKHQTALTLLEYGLMNQASFSVITGDIGTGKTTLIRHLLNRMGRDMMVGLISNTHSSFGELLQWILLAFNLESTGKDRVDSYKTFVDFLIKQYSLNRRTVLVVDEAQNMSHQALEELRMLSNVNSEKDQVLQVILLGQPGLRDNLRDPRLEQFAQRIAVDYNLEPLDKDETRNYIRYRIEVAGGNPDTFDDEACDVIFRYSGGTPRLINLLCDTALVYGYAEQSRCIDGRLAEDVVRDKQMGGVVPLKQKNIADSELKLREESTAGGTDMFTIESTPRKLRVAVASDSERQRSYLKTILERSGFQVVAVVPVNEELVEQVHGKNAEVLLIDLDEAITCRSYDLERIVDRIRGDCRIPVLFNDGTSAGVGGAISDIGSNLTLKLTSIVGRG